MTTSDVPDKTTRVLEEIVGSGITVALILMGILMIGLVLYSFFAR
jgi:hypothetical protein